MAIHLNYNYYCYQINPGLNHYYSSLLNQLNYFPNFLNNHFAEIINLYYCLLPIRSPK